MPAVGAPDPCPADRRPRCAHAALRATASRRTRLIDASKRPDRPGRRLRHEATGAGIVVPEGWTERARGDGSGPLLLAASRERDGIPPGRCVTSVNLVAEPCDDPLDERSAATIAGQREHLPGFVLLDVERGSLVGRAAVRSLFSYRLDPFQIVVDQWLIVEGGWAWCLSGGTDTVGFPDAARVLEGIAATLELPGELPARDGTEAPPAATVPGDEFPTGADVDPPALVATESDLLAVVQDTAGLDIPAKRADAARYALARRADLSGDGLTERLDALLAPVRAHARRIELHVDGDLILGWIAGDSATLLAPEGDDLAVLWRVAPAELPVALAGSIPSLPAASERPSDGLELPPGVLASVLATGGLPDPIMPGAGRDTLLARTDGLRAWWRLEVHDRHVEVPPRIVEGLDADDGPWSLSARDDMARLEPIRPRDLFARLCRELASQAASR